MHGLWSVNAIELRIRTFRKRNFSVNLNASSVRFLTFQLATATTKVTDYVTSILFRRFYFNLHDRLKQNRFRFLETIFKGNRGSQFKRQLGGVNVVVRTEVQTHTEIYYRITC